MASKTKKHTSLLLGVVLAFIITDGLAILLGDFITRIVPINYVKMGSGILFVTIGVITLFNHKKEEEKREMKNPFVSGFVLTLLSEMGDKSQIVSGLFATRFNPVLVFIGVISALTILSLTAVYLGKVVMKKINKKTISLAAGIIFILVGIASFLF